MAFFRFPKIAIAVLALMAAAAAAFGQKFSASSQLNAGPILPNSFGAFTAVSRQEVPAVTNGSGASDPAIAASHEYGLVSGETATYSLGAAQDGAKASPPAMQATLTVALYKMKDPTGAYGQYSYLRAPDMAAADFAAHSAIKADEALILMGNLVLDVKGADAQHRGADIKALVATVAQKAQTGDLPSLPDRLPLDGRIAKTDHYILGPQTLDQFFPGSIGNSLGFSYGTEAETAHFHIGKNDATLLIADFPTPQIAQAQLDLLEKRFNVNGSQENGSTQAAAAPALYAVRNQTLLAIVANAPTQLDANRLLDQVKSGTVLTWSEPTFQFKEPSIEVMILGAFLGTGAICMITLAGALAFSGFRLGIKKMFPNTIFDRSTQIDILQLGLVSKPIKAEDFYTFDGKRIDTSKVDKNLPDRTALRLFK